MSWQGEKEKLQNLLVRVLTKKAKNVPEVLKINFKTHQPHSPHWLYFPCGSPELSTNEKRWKKEQILCKQKKLEIVYKYGTPHPYTYLSYFIFSHWPCHLLIFDIICNFIYCPVPLLKSKLYEGMDIFFVLFSDASLVLKECLAHRRHIISIWWIE